MPVSTEGGTETSQSDVPEEADVAEESTEVEPPPPDELAMAEALLEKNPENGSQHAKNILGMLSNVEKNIEGMKNHDKQETPQYAQLEKLVPKLEGAAEDQGKINNALSAAGLNTDILGVALALPGIGIVFNPPDSQLYSKFANGGEPMKSVDAFITQISELAVELKKDAAESYKKLKEQLKKAADYAADRCRDCINREKQTVRYNVQGRKESGWFGGASRLLTLSDPYQIEIDNARQKASNMMNHAQPAIDEALAMIQGLPDSVDDLANNPPDFAQIRELTDRTMRYVRTNSRVDTDNSHWEQEQKALDVTEQAAWVAIEAIAMVGTMGGSAAVSSGRAGLRLASNGVKHGYKLFKTGSKVVLAGSVTAGVVAEQYREDPSETAEAKQKSMDADFSAEVIELVMSDPQKRKEILAAKVMDKLPNSEEFIYTEDLLHMVETDSGVIGKLLMDYAVEGDEQKQVELMKTISEKIEQTSASVLDQFLRDNLGAGSDEYDDYVDAQSYRAINDPHHIEALAGQMGIIADIAKGDTASALLTARSYVQDKLLGIQEDTVPSSKAVKLIEAMAQNMVNIAQQQAYPLFVAAVQKYSQKGMTQAFMDRMNMTKDFVGDAIAAPFSDESYQRIADTTVPAAMIALGVESDYEDIGDLIVNAASAAGHVVAKEDIDIAGLVATIGGTFAFDAIVVAATAGAGAAGSALSKGGGLSKVTGRLAQASSFAPGVLTKGRIPYAAVALTLPELNKRIQGSVS